MDKPLHPKTQWKIFCSFEAGNDFFFSFSFKRFRTPWFSFRSTFRVFGGSGEVTARKIILQLLKGSNGYQHLSFQAAAAGRSFPYQGGGGASCWPVGGKGPIQTGRSFSSSRLFVHVSLPHSPDLLAYPLRPGHIDRLKVHSGT